MSTANYCLSLDRGYGHIEAQINLGNLGIYSNSMMQATRIGLPRAYVAELATDLGSCSREVQFEVDEVPRHGSAHTAPTLKPAGSIAGQSYINRVEPLTPLARRGQNGSYLCGRILVS